MGNIHGNHKVGLKGKRFICGTMKEKPNNQKNDLKIQLNFQRIQTGMSQYMEFLQSTNFLFVLTTCIRKKKFCFPY